MQETIFKVEVNHEDYKSFNFTPIGYYSDGVTATRAGKIYLMFWAIDKGIYDKDSNPLPMATAYESMEGSHDGAASWVYDYGGEKHIIRAHKMLLDSKFIFAPDDPILKDRACQPK